MVGKHGVAKGLHTHEGGGLHQHSAQDHGGAHPTTLDAVKANEEEQDTLERVQQAIDEAYRCDCWVAGRPEEERLQIRYGAHCADCPAYRESGDPVDRDNDVELHVGQCDRTSPGSYCTNRPLNEARLMAEFVVRGGPPPRTEDYGEAGMMAAWLVRGAG